MELVNICMDCGYEWEENNANRCKKCGSGDFYREIDEGLDYKNISTEECFVLYHTNNIACECDADRKEVNFKEEK